MIHDRIIDKTCIFEVFNLEALKQERLYENIIAIADFFGIGDLPDELLIKIYICQEEEFLKKARLYIEDSSQVIAFTCDVNKIYVLEYECINDRYSINEYEALIIHECTHVFQAYFSMLPPEQYVWLYETVACYLAKQEKTYTGRNRVLWDDFVNDFYKIDECYGLAYIFGKEIFNCFGEEILNVLKNPEAYTDRLKWIYDSKILK